MTLCLNYTILLIQILLHLQRGDDFIKKNFDVLKNSVLFKGINDDELSSLLKCLNAKNKSFKKNEIIIPFENFIDKVGIILSGNVQIIKEDFEGNRIIVAELFESDIFGETFVFAGVKKSPVCVTASSDCDILFVDCNKIITNCTSACLFHTKLIENMLMLICQKNIMLNSKLDIVSKKSTREKLIAYFEIQIKQNGSLTFKIPFSREELADYICVNRSAMSRELSKMRDEKIIDFNKETFNILKQTPPY